MSNAAYIMYQSFLESGDLKEMFPKAKGEWEKDKKWFTTHWNKQQDLINEFDSESFNF